MSLNAIGSGQKLEQISVITGSNPGSSAAFEAQLAAALLPNALPPAFLSKGPSPEQQIPIGFCAIYSKLIAYDGSYRV
jgi:hypothetical protein